MSELSTTQQIALAVYVVLFVLAAGVIPLWRDRLPFWRDRLNRSSITVTNEAVIRVGSTFEMSGKRYTVTRVEGSVVTVLESLETLPDSYFSGQIQ